jgi:hypothetical protein
VNDNNKSPLDEALDAVEQAADVTEREYDEARKGLREIAEDDKQKKRGCRSVH